jgi:hypothetical protein
MPVSLQLFPHSSLAHHRHALRYRNLRGLWNWHGRFGSMTNVEELASCMVEGILERGGVFHLWGHSWEIEQQGLWPVFERLAAMLGGLTDVARFTNAELLGIGPR